MLGLVKSCVQWVLDRRQEWLETACARDVHQLLGGEVLSMVDVGAPGGAIQRVRVAPDAAFRLQCEAFLARLAG